LIFHFAFWDLHSDFKIMCRKLLATLLAILFFFSFTTVLYIHNFKLVFLRPAVYKALIEEGRITDALSSFLSGVFKTAMQGDKSLGQGASPLPGVSPDALNRIVEQAFPQTWMEEELGGLVDNFFTWFYSDEEELELTISLKEVKQNLGSSFGDLIGESFTNMPKCTPEQVQKLQKGDQGVFCLPPGMSEEDVAKFSEAFEQEGVLDQMFEGLPDEIDLLNLGQKESVPKKAADSTGTKSPIVTLNKFRDYAQLAFFILYIVTAAVFVSLIFIGLLVWKPLSSVFKKVGTTILVPAILVLLTSVVLVLFSRFGKPSTLLKFAGPGLEKTIDPAMFDGISSIFNDLISKFTLYKIIESGAAVVVAIALIVLGVVLGRMKKPE